MSLNELLEESQQKVLKRIKDEKIEFIYFQFADVQGKLKSAGYMSEDLEGSFRKGRAFDGSSIEGLSRIGESDKFIIPDSESFMIIPFFDKNGKVEEKIAWITGSIYNPDGNPFDGDSRFILKNAMEHAKERNLRYFVAPEIEFFLFKKDENGNVIFPLEPVDKAGYFDSHSRDSTYPIRQSIVKTLKACGFTTEAIHHEVAPGQNEIGFQYDDALKTAERILLYKYIVTAIADRNNLQASFMPKPIYGINGSGMHVHENLADLDGKNLFYDPNGIFNLSDLALKFTAGQLKHADALCAVTDPTVNSYKRLVEGYEAPVNICWGQLNRSALIRIPLCRRGEEKSARLEFRCPDSSSNPYLAFSAMYAAGMDGVDSNLMPPDPVGDNTYELSLEKLRQMGIGTLPSSLGKALDALKNDEVIKLSINGAYNSFVAAKEKEIKEYQSQITNKEYELYL